MPGFPLRVCPRSRWTGAKEASLGNIATCHWPRLNCSNVYTYGVKNSTSYFLVLKPSAPKVCSTLAWKCNHRPSLKRVIKPQRLTASARDTTGIPFFFSFFSLHSAVHIAFPHYICIICRSVGTSIIKYIYSHCALHMTAYNVTPGETIGKSLQSI